MSPYFNSAEGLGRPPGGPLSLARSPWGFGALGRPNNFPSSRASESSRETVNWLTKSRDSLAAHRVERWSHQMTPDSSSESDLFYVRFFLLDGTIIRTGSSYKVAAVDVRYKKKCNFTSGDWPLLERYRTHSHAVRSSPKVQRTNVSVYPFPPVCQIPQGGRGSIQQFIHSMTPSLSSLQPAACSICSILCTNSVQHGMHDRNPDILQPLHLTAACWIFIVPSISTLTLQLGHIYSRGFEIHFRNCKSQNFQLP